MVNTVEFTSRLKKILEHHHLTASQFADQIGVQRSSISHILSGRNKPSLDFVLKVTNQFSDVDIYWLLNGKGSYPKNGSSSPTSLFSQPEVPSQSNITSRKKISRIVVFYNDGTFDEYHK
jgi:transcriptional regulator with XRE-family HTH domain